VEITFDICGKNFESASARSATPRPANLCPAVDCILGLLSRLGHYFALASRCQSAICSSINRNSSNAIFS